MTEVNETHPDHFLIGHAIWMDVTDTKSFARALNKLVVDFKDLKEIEWNIFKEVLEDTPLGDINETSYFELIKNLQDYFYYKEEDVGGVIDNISKLMHDKD